MKEKINLRNSQFNKAINKENGLDHNWYIIKDIWND